MFPSVSLDPITSCHLTKGKGIPKTELVASNDMVISFLSFLYTRVLLFPGTQAISEGARIQGVQVQLLLEHCSLRTILNTDAQTSWLYWKKSYCLCFQSFL